ncbi:MAG: hemolysin family protein [Phycisphaerae bacterium]|nr:hemolysin family protein [Phycisphaerae bacterium]
MFSIWFWLGLATTAVAMFFSVVGVALSSFSPTRLKEAFARRDRAGRFDILSEHLVELMQVTAALRLFSIAAAVVFTGLWVSGSGRGSGLWAAILTIVISGAVLTIFVGIIATAWARYAGEGVLIRAAPVLFACRSVFIPMRKIFSFFDILVRRLAGVSAEDGTNSHIGDHLRALVVEGEREGAIDEDEKQMIEGIFEFGQADAAKIMTPRTDIVSVEAEAPLKDVQDLIISKGHSRIPVHEGSLDAIVGMLYAKDLLREFHVGGTEGRRVAEVMRKAIFVPETKKLDELLSEFQSAKVHIAVVLDEYGGTAGIVTIEDVLEEIVGEIADEYETEPEPVVKQIDEKVFEVDARVHIDDFNEEVHAALPEDEDYETVGGFVFSVLGYIPKVGEVFEQVGLRFTVLDAEERKINKLRVEVLPKDA